MRVLPVDEWPRLSQVPCDTPWWLFDPVRARVLVVEDAGQIVATCALLPFVHAECLWIAETHKRAGRRLLRGVYQQARAMGARSLWSGSLSERMTSILYRLGATRLPGFSYVFPVKGERCLQQ